MTLPSSTVSDLSPWHKDHSFSLRIILYKCTFYVGRKSTNPMAETHGREERGLYESHKINGFCVQGEAQNSRRIRPLHFQLSSQSFSSIDPGSSPSPTATVWDRGARTQHATQGCQAMRRHPHPAPALGTLSL